MTDQLDELFQGLRAETIPEVRPPGVAATRRTVRRRRVVTSVSAGAAAMVLVLAGFVAMVRPQFTPPPVSTEPPASPSVYPEAVLTDSLERGLGLPDLGFHQIYPNPGQSPAETRHALLAGTYTLQLGCFGTGSVEVTAGRPVTVPCSAEKQLGALTTTEIREIEVTIPEPSGILTITSRPHVAGAGQAAYGWKLQMANRDRDRWSNAAQKLLDRPDFHSLASFFMDDDQGSDDETVSPGSYRISAVCVGFGTATLTVGSQSATVPCALTGAVPASIVTSVTGTLSPTLSPDDAARARAGGAVLVEPL